METLSSNGTIDRRGTAYSSILQYCNNEDYNSLAFCTVYGFVLKGSVSYNNTTLLGSHYFSCAVTDPVTFKVNGTTVFITRLGYQGQHTTGGPIEKTGRLTYIDGCSDTLLVYPPRLGDPSLNVLYFPKDIDQTFHIHPSLRMGIVASGNGLASTNDGDSLLTARMAFCLDPMERHRFKTTDSEMIIIAYHPDGDWGPTDHNHTMLNRTYI
jgi:hypothetical protein